MSRDGRGHIATVIALGVRVDGDFSSQGDVVIDGEMNGTVVVSGMLTVGPQARLKADVSAEKALIAGTIEGNLTVVSHLDLKATATLLGDITCETASVESGASVQGKVVIGVKTNVKTKEVGASVV